MANGGDQGGDYRYRYPSGRPSTTSAMTVVLGVMVSIALIAQVVISFNQSRLNDKILDQQVRACVDRDEIHKVVSDALKASLTEEDVQANKPQREAYELVIRKFAMPENCAKL